LVFPASVVAGDPRRRWLSRLLRGYRADLIENSLHRPDRHPQNLADLDGGDLAARGGGVALRAKPKYLRPASGTLNVSGASDGVRTLRLRVVIEVSSRL